MTGLFLSSDERVYSADGREFDPWDWSWGTAEPAPPPQGEMRQVIATEALRAIGRSGKARKVPIGVIGPRDATDAQIDLATKLGRELASLGLTVMCGGKNGVMQAVAQGVHEAGGLCVGLLPEGDWREANPYIALPIATGIGKARKRAHRPVLRSARRRGRPVWNAVGDRIRPSFRQAGLRPGRSPRPRRHPQGGLGAGGLRRNRGRFCCACPDCHKTYIGRRYAVINFTWCTMIELRNVTRHFGPVTVLEGISLAAEEGAFLALLGPSGCGKSTLLRIIAGLDRPNSGEVLIGGRDVSGLTAAQRNIAMVFQSYALYPHLTVAENIALPLAMRGQTRLERSILGRFDAQCRRQTGARRGRGFARSPRR